MKSTIVTLMGAAMLVSLSLPAMATPVVTEGLVAAYEFSGNTSDSSGNGYDAVNYGAVLVEDRNGMADSAYRFDGHEWMAVDNFTSLTSYTISGWVNWDSISGWRPFIDDVDGWGENVRFEIYNDKLSLSDRFSDPINVEAGKWYQIAVSYDDASSSISYYFNGAEVGSVISSMPAFDDYFEMGRGLYGWDEYLSGYMDDIYIYDRALDGNEIESLYNGTEPVPEPATMLLFGTGLAGLAGWRKRQSS